MAEVRILAADTHTDVYISVHTLSSRCPRALQSRDQLKLKVRVQSSTHNVQCTQCDDTAVLRSGTARHRRMCMRYNALAAADTSNSAAGNLM